MNRPVIASLVSALAAAACGSGEPEHADGVMDPGDAQGCPTGGSVHVVTTYHAPADQPDPSPPSFDVEGSIAFGPACNAPS